MVATRSLPIVALLLLAALAASGGSLPGCTGGTMPVCDDAGSCLIVPAGGTVDGGAVDGGGIEASAGMEAGPGSDASDAGDAAAE